MPRPHSFHLLTALSMRHFTTSSTITYHALYPINHKLTVFRSASTCVFRLPLGVGCRRLYLPCDSNWHYSYISEVILFAHGHWLGFFSSGGRMRSWRRRV